MTLPRAVALVWILTFTLVATGDEPVVIRNQENEVRVVRVELRGALHGGMVQPPSEGEAFLLVFLETTDPCFDSNHNAACFPEAAHLSQLDRVTWACGELLLGLDETRPADGAGQLEGELACSFIVPVSAPPGRLRLRGYPEIDLAPAPSRADLSASPGSRRPPN